MNSKLPRTILYVHSSDEMYGADLILLELVERLDKRFFHPIVVIPTDIPYQGSLTKALLERQITTIHLKTAILRRKYFTPWGFFLYLFRLAISTLALIKIIRSESVDIVHSNTAAVIPGALAARLTGKNHIWHIHEIIVRPRFLWRLTSWLLPRLSDCIVTVSGPTLEHLCLGDKRNFEKAIVIHNGIDIKRFEKIGHRREQIRNEWRISPDQHLIGMVGRFSHWKGQEYFLQVAQLVAKTHPNARFALVGGTFPGQEEIKQNVQEAAIKLGLLQVTIFSDFRNDIPAVLDAFDIFVLPSTLPDPLPTVVLEAMAASKPVVANAHGGAVEMVVNGQTGVLVPPDHPELMASAIQNLLDNPEDREKMGRMGRERLENYFSLASFINKWTEVYRQL